MISTDRFVYIHLHKSGGTFVNECLLRFFPDARRLGYHLPRSMIPPGFAALPVLGFVRNPWSYYVSWYAFQSARSEPNMLYRTLSEDGALGFNATICNMLTLGDTGGKLAQLLPHLPTRYGNRGLNLPRFALEPIRGTGMGFYSHLFRYMYGDDPRRLHIGRTESLRPDLLGFLLRQGVLVTEELRAFIGRHAALNASTHGDYRQYYEVRTRQLVAERDRSLIERFGYRFDG